MAPGRSSSKGRNILPNSSDRRAIKKDAYKESGKKHNVSKNKKTDNKNSKGSRFNRDETSSYQRSSSKDRFSDRNSSSKYSKSSSRDKLSDRNSSSKYSKSPSKGKYSDRNSENSTNKYSSKNYSSSTRDSTRTRIKPPKREFFRVESKGEYGVKTDRSGFTSYRSRNDEKNEPREQRLLNSNKNSFRKTLDSPVREGRYSSKYSNKEESKKNTSTKFDRRKSNKSRNDEPHERIDYNDEPEEPIETFKTKCAACGKDCEVPFIPKKDNPLYCNTCFKKKKRNKLDKY